MTANTIIIDISHLFTCKSININRSSVRQTSAIKYIVAYIMPHTRRQNAIKWAQFSNRLST